MAEIQTRFFKLSAKVLFGIAFLFLAISIWSWIAAFSDGSSAQKDFALLGAFSSPVLALAFFLFGLIRLKMNSQGEVWEGQVQDAQRTVKTRIAPFFAAAFFVLSALCIFYGFLNSHDFASTFIIGLGILFFISGIISVLIARRRS